MFLHRKRIVVTGGSGRFASVLKNTKNKYNLFFPSKKQLDILKFNTIKKYLKIKKPKYLLHLAGLSRPMKIHHKKMNKSIDLNIIGTANIVKACSEQKIKLIYFSTSYVYPGLKGNYKETDALLPQNNYSWSKLGGESSVHMYKNSLILRVCMTEKPFLHKKAFSNIKLNFIFHDKLAKILIKIIHKKGIINVGGPTKTVYNFAKKFNPKIKKIFVKKTSKINFPLKPYMNLNKLNKLIR